MHKILLEILGELKSYRAANTELWNVDDIARYIRLSRSSTQSRIICREDFPRTVRIPTNNGLSCDDLKKVQLDKAVFHVQLVCADSGIEILIELLT